jgi:hypothetical protein
MSQYASSPTTVNRVPNISSQWTTSLYSFSKARRSFIESRYQPLILIIGPRGKSGSNQLKVFSFVANNCTEPRRDDEQNMM